MSIERYVLVGGLLLALAFVGGVVQGQTERFELEGNMKFFGAENGIIFSDGTKQTSADSVGTLTASGTFTAEGAVVATGIRSHFNTVPLRDRCSFGRFTWLISQALSVTYMAGERRLYLERNCRLPESPAHSRRRNREGPASSKGLNS